MDAGSPWHGWAVDQLQACSEQGPLHVNLAVYTELLIPGTAYQALDAMLDIYDTRRSPLPWASAGLAAAAYRIYRASGGTRRTPLPDFYIGAHAAVANLSVLSRHAKPYRRYFPRLRCVA